MRDVDGLNAGFAELLLEEYLGNPDAVPAEWRAVSGTVFGCPRRWAIGRASFMLARVAYRLGGIAPNAVMGLFIAGLLHALARWGTLPRATVMAPAIALAKHGYDVVATDIASSAIAKARHAASREDMRGDFRVDNILDSHLEDALVDAIVDRGVFHAMPPESRPRYVARVARILRPRGYLFLKAFSDQEPRQDGPYHFSPEELRSCFQESFEVLSIQDAIFHGTLEESPKALIAVFRRR